MARRDAKTFALHWGRGIIEEEAQIVTPYHCPTIQLLKFTEGEAAGTYEIRFCHYDHRGRFQRSPLIVDARDVPRLGQALDRTPTLRRLLAGLARQAQRTARPTRTGRSRRRSGAARS
jgi:hypothetical protein